MPRTVRSLDLGRLTHSNVVPTDRLRARRHSSPDVLNRLFASLPDVLNMPLLTRNIAFAVFFKMFGIRVERDPYVRAGFSAQERRWIEEGALDWVPPVLSNDATAKQSRMFASASANSASSASANSASSASSASTAGRSYSLIILVSISVIIIYLRKQMFMLQRKALSRHTKPSVRRTLTLRRRI
jgi:hypothetical protein